MKCKERLAAYLKENGVAFKEMTHPTAYTSQEVAAAQGVSGKQVAKVVIVKVDEQPAMLVLQAAKLVDLAKAKEVLGTQKVRLAKEGEFVHLFPDCELGSMPPFGNLYDVPVYVDEGLAAVPQFVFEVGSHTETFKMAFADYAKLANPTLAAFSK